jgi:hypothetical protein
MSTARTSILISASFLLSCFTSLRAWNGLYIGGVWLDPPFSFLDGESGTQDKLRFTEKKYYI